MAALCRDAATGAGLMESWLVGWDEQTRSDGQLKRGAPRVVEKILRQLGGWHAPPPGPRLRRAGPPACPLRALEGPAPI